MNCKRGIRTALVATMALVAVGNEARADLVLPVADWALHNGTGTVGNSTNSPTFSVADNNTFMGRFANVLLSNAGDFVSLSATLNVNTRTNDNLGPNSLNTQLRLGLFNGPDSAVALMDSPNLGFLIEYSNTSGGGRISTQTNTSQKSPLTNANIVGNGSPDAGDDTLQGADLGPVGFQLKLSRNASGMIDLTGAISGTDSTNGHPYAANFAQGNLDASVIGFAFDRVGFFFGDKVDGVNGATLSDVNITTNVAAVPESRFGMGLIAVITCGGAAAVRVRRVRHAGAAQQH
jgi:hypothetical protein